MIDRDELERLAAGVARHEPDAEQALSVFIAALPMGLQPPAETIAAAFIAAERAKGAAA